jgi:hypothetical protein
MSYLMDQALHRCNDPQRLADIADNETLMNVFSCYEGFHVGEVALIEMPLEPSEEDFVAADIARNAGKGQRLAARNDAYALDLQIQMQGFIGGLPL